MTDDFEDLLGSPKTRVKIGRPTNEERRLKAEATMAEEARKAEIRRAGTGKTRVGMEAFQMPCTQQFLADVWGMDPMTVRKRLMGKGLEVGSVGGGRQVYNFTEASKYLIKPKMDLATYLRTLNPGDMPHHINKVFWEAERIKNKTMLETGEAWPTSKVVEVLGTVFMMVKDRIPLITESLRDMGATDQQQAKLLEMCDQFQKDLHEALVELPAKQQTFSRQAEIEEFGDPVEEIE